MYVPVHKKDNCWYRTDTGEFVGYSVPLNEALILRSIYGDKLFVKNGEKNLIIYQGYFIQNTFYHFCKNFSNCIRCNRESKKLFCGKGITGNYYIKL